MDLHSVNYLHYGAPKQWYCIPPPYRARFEAYVKDTLSDLFRACPQFFRHKARSALNLLPLNRPGQSFLSYDLKLSLFALLILESYPGDSNSSIAEIPPEPQLKSI